MSRLFGNLISEENKGIFFSTERIGDGGEIFDMYKFRTMNGSTSHPKVDELPRELLSAES